MRNNYSGTVSGAELCTPLRDVHIVRKKRDGACCAETFSDNQGGWHLEDVASDDIVSFTLDGFVEKQYQAHSLPQIVRLLEDHLIGYQKRLWFSPGESVEVYVHSPALYHPQLFRHGFMKERVLDLNFHQPQIQHVPDGHFVENGLKWDKSFCYTIPQDARPGLYSLYLESQTQEPFAIPMVVSTPKRQYGQHSKLLFLVSTNTWQSYNLWGGRSRYRNFEEGTSSDFYQPSAIHKFVGNIVQLLPDHLKMFLKNSLRKANLITDPDWPFKKLSIQRPFTNCALEEDKVFQPFTNHLAAGEWRLLAWLEREGINYDIISGAELHYNPALLQHYDAIILSTHSEYWTSAMYEGLKYYHEKEGLWILNISGNSIYREIEFFEDGSTRCVSLHFSESCADETQVLGVRYTDGDYSTCAPYKIIAPDHWVFNNVPIPRSQIFGGLALNQNTSRKSKRYDPGRPGFENSLDGLGASGWETDKISKTAPKDLALIAKGLNKRGGADMVIREPSGTQGGMFSASSLIFGSALLIDYVASELVKNIIYRISKVWYSPKTGQNSKV